MKLKIRVLGTLTERFPNYDHEKGIDVKISDGARVERMGRLQDKVAIVTGAARGAGEGMARAMAKEGAIVALWDILKHR